MNGEIAEPWVMTSKMDNNTNKKIIGRSQNFLRSIRNSKNSLIKDSIITSFKNAFRNV